MAVGRPMIRDGAHISAVGCSSDHKEWCQHKKHVITSEGSAAERKRAGDFYLNIALLEHASVAAFHHFALELMRLGAPVELLEGAHEAIKDEMRHAKQAFSLAADLLETPMGRAPYLLIFSFEDIVSLPRRLREKPRSMKPLR